MRKIILSLFIGLLIGCSGEPEIKLPDINQVGMDDVYKIIQSSGLKPLQQIKSTDSRDSEKQIYKFDQVYTQLEYSKNFVLIAWRHHEQASIDKAVRLGIASLGNDAGYFIHRVDLNGEHTDYSIGGHKITQNSCVKELCMIKINRGIS